MCQRVYPEATVYACYSADRVVPFSLLFPYFVVTLTTKGLIDFVEEIRRSAEACKEVLV